MVPLFPNSSLIQPQQQKQRIRLTSFGFLGNILLYGKVCLLNFGIGNKQVLHILATKFVLQSKSIAKRHAQGSQVPVISVKWTKRWRNTNVIGQTGQIEIERNVWNVCVCRMVSPQNGFRLWFISRIDFKKCRLPFAEANDQLVKRICSTGSNFRTIIQQHACASCHHKLTSVLNTKKKNS